MEALAAHLFAADWLSLRTVVRLLLLSALFSLAVIWAFPKNARSRRALLLAAAAALSVLPWASSRYLGVWGLPVNDMPTMTLALLLPNLLLWIWLGIAVLLLTRLALSIRRELREIAALPPLDDPRVLREARALCERLDLTAPTLRWGESAYATTLVGNDIVLPSESASWDLPTLRSVLAHELVHVRRRDDRWLLLVRVLVVFYWWMPWLRLLERGYASAMEESCDDAASELVGHELTYVSALALAAGAGSASRTEPVATRSNRVAMHSRHLVGRIRRFGETRRVELDTGAVYWLVIGILATVALATSFEPVTAERQFLSPAPVALKRAQLGEPEMPALFPETRSRIEIPRGAFARLEKQLARAEYAPPVVYPGRAIRARTEGDVTIEFRVNRDGSTSQAIVVASEPAGVFDRAALRAVEGTRYPPSYSTSSAAYASGTAAQATARPTAWRASRIASIEQTNQTSSLKRGVTRRPPDRVYRHFSFRLDER